MKDKFEEFIERHRDEFDAHTPPARVWDAIRKDLPRKKVPLYRNYAAVAAVLLIIISFTWFMQPISIKVAGEAGQHATGNTEIAEAATYYRNLVDNKKTELHRYCGQYPDVCSDFAAEMDTLARYYHDLEAELATTADKNVVKEAMIENLQAQVAIAGRQLQIMEQVKNNRDNKI